MGSASAVMFGYLTVFFGLVAVGLAVAGLITLVT